MRMRVVRGLREVEVHARMRHTGMVVLHGVTAQGRPTMAVVEMVRVRAVGHRRRMEGTWGREGGV